MVGKISDESRACLDAAIKTVSDISGLAPASSPWMFEIAEGYEAWIHEASHLLLLQGDLNMPPGLIRTEDWISSRIVDIKNRIGSIAGQSWGVDHEIKTLAVELLVLDAIGIEINIGDLIDYSLNTGNLAPRWRWRIDSKMSLVQKQITEAIETAQGTPEVVEAAAFLSRRLTKAPRGEGRRR